MFIVMNRFQINNGREEEFESMWRGRERYLDGFEGFQSFQLLRNDRADNGTTEFISHTIWRSRADFEAWRNSESFQRAHGNAGSQGVVAGPPHASLYEVVIEEVNEKAAVGG
jgi:heme-degrading monooxygenase HmoA